MRVLGRASTLPLKYWTGVWVQFLCCVSLPCVLECGFNRQQGSMRSGEERVDTHATCVTPPFARTEDIVATCFLGTLCSRAKEDVQVWNKLTNHNKTVQCVVAVCNQSLASVTPATV